MLHSAISRTPIGLDTKTAEALQRLLHHIDQKQPIAHMGIWEWTLFLPTLLKEGAVLQEANVFCAIQSIQCNVVLKKLLTSICRNTYKQQDVIKILGKQLQRQGTQTAPASFSAQLYQVVPDSLAFNGCAAQKTDWQELAKRILKVVGVV